MAQHRENCHIYESQILKATLLHRALWETNGASWSIRIRSIRRKDDPRILLCNPQLVGSLANRDQWVRRGARNFMGFHNNGTHRVHGGLISSMGIGEVESSSAGVVVLLKVACLIASNIW